MPNNHADAIFNGLSNFWLRLFADRDSLRAMYQGTSILLGQAYLDILQTALNTSVLDAPLFRKEYYKLITLRGDKFRYADDGIVGHGRYTYSTGEYLSNINALQNLILNATAALDGGIDFFVQDGELLFPTDPTEPVPDGFAVRSVDVAIAGTFQAVDWVAAGVKPGDKLALYQGSANLLVTVTPITVVKVTTTDLVLEAGSVLPLNTAAACSWTVTRLRTDGVTITVASSTSLDGALTVRATYPVNELMAWVADARVDEQTLYNNFGYLIHQDPRASSEVYRQFLRGIMQLYLFGPAVARIVSALNLVAGFRLIARTGETLQSYDSGVNFFGTDGVLVGTVFSSASGTWTAGDVGGTIAIQASAFPENIVEAKIAAVNSAHSVVLIPPVGGFTNDTAISYRYSFLNHQTVVTDLDSYEYPIDIPIRDDIKDSLNWGSLTFDVFEALTTAIKVVDYIEDPEWWHHIVIPQELLPDWTPARRTVTPELYPNTLGPDNGNLFLGDPGFILGADSAGTASANPHHHTAAFMMMDQYLKFHMFKVDLDRHIDLHGTLAQEMVNLLRDVKPTYTYLYFQSNTSFNDTIAVTDSALTVDLIYAFLDLLAPFDNALKIDGTWSLGDVWRFTNPTGGAVTINGGGTNNTPFFLGGDNPLTLPAGGDVAIVDRPLYVYAHT
jgi:hypothetical protein